MNFDLLTWIYLINSVILLNHEIDSGYWQEWKLINPADENGIRWFLILHFPVIFIVLYGLLLIHEERSAGMIISLLLSLGGIFAFFFHNYHLGKGKPEFNSAISKIILFSALIISFIQLALTVKIYFDL